MLDDPYAKWISYPQGILYYPTSHDVWDSDAVHIRYDTDTKLSEEDYRNHKAMLDLMYDVFWLAYDLKEQVQQGLNKESPSEYLRGRILIDKPEIWAFLPRIMRWWHDVGFPNWSPIDLFEETLSEVRNHYSGRVGYVYLVEGADGWFKIGRSKNAVSRIEKLGVLLPFSIETKNIIETDDMYRLESNLHKIFSESRGRGEWFALSSEDVEAISGIKSIFFMPRKV